MKDRNGTEIKEGDLVMCYPAKEERKIVTHPKKGMTGLVVVASEGSYCPIDEKRALTMCVMPLRAKSEEKEG